MTTANGVAARADANREAIERVLACEPRLVGVRPAGEVVPELASDLILHAAPPTSWSRRLRAAPRRVVGAALFEGLAGARGRLRRSSRAGEIRLAAAQDHHAMAGGAARSWSMPVVVLEDAGRAAGYHFLMEGFGATLVLGMFGEDVLDRLTWLRDELARRWTHAPGAGRNRSRPIIAEALRRGDELHNRNAAATSMLAERLAAGFASAGDERGRRLRALGFMAGNPQFFVACSLAASPLPLTLAKGSGLEPVTAAGANGPECGIKVAGLPDRWFTAPAELPEGVVLEGSTG